MYIKQLNGYMVILQNNLMTLCSMILMIVCFVLSNANLFMLFTISGIYCSSYIENY